MERISSAALGLLGAAMAVPVGLAQLDFAGILNTFGIDHGDTPAGVLVLVGVSGIGTAAVVLVALAGACLVATESGWGRRLLLVAALGGIPTATILWIGPGFLLGLAAHVAECASRADVDVNRPAEARA